MHIRLQDGRIITQLGLTEGGLVAFGSRKVRGDLFSLRPYLQPSAQLSSH